MTAVVCSRRRHCREIVNTESKSEDASWTMKFPMSAASCCCVAIALLINLEVCSAFTAPRGGVQTFSIHRTTTAATSHASFASLTRQSGMNVLRTTSSHDESSQIPSTERMNASESPLFVSQTSKAARNVFPAAVLLQTLRHAFGIASASTAPVSAMSPIYGKPAATAAAAAASTPASTAAAASTALSTMATSAFATCAALGARLSTNLQSTLTSLLATFAALGARLSTALAEVDASAVSTALSTMATSVFATCAALGARLSTNLQSTLTSLLATFAALGARLSTALAEVDASAVSTALSTMATSAFATCAALGARLSTNLQSTLTNGLTTIRASPRSAIKPIVYTSLIIYALTTLWDIVATRKRQSVDATSEWGRYADDPAARGKALMILCMQITPYLMVAQLLKLLPGGKNKADQMKEGAEEKVNGGVNGSKVNGASANDNDDEPTTWAQRKSESLKTKSGNLFADGLLRLGPLYIKIGQILSCRENLLPEEWIPAMAKLQDRVPAKSGQEALDLVYAAMPGGKAEFDATFSEFDDVPLAAASLGQVHRAKLRSSGEDVAIKVQRARLRDIYDKDLALMHKIATGVDKFGDMMGGRGNVGGVEQSWSQIFNDAEVILYREIDYRDEADNAYRFATDFGLGLGGKAIESTALSMDGKPLPSAAEWMRTPYTYKELSSEKLLVMEFVPSVKVTDNKKLNAAGVTKEDKEFLAESLARAYLRQFCANRFFSTDPHPGNLGVEVVDDGEKLPRMVFYDFGQACALSEDQAGGILDVIEGITDMDAKACVTAFDRMGVLKDGADLKKVQAKVQNNFDTGKISVKEAKRKQQAKMKARKNRTKATRKEEHDKVIAENNSTQVNGSNTTIAAVNGEKEVTEEAPQPKPKKEEKPPGDAEVMEYFTLPAEYAFVARAISQLDGVGKALDPEFDFISASAPHIVEVKGAEKYLADEAKKTLVGFEKKAAEIEGKILETFGWDVSVFSKKKES